MFFSHNYDKIRIDRNGDLPLDETPIFHNVIILIKFVSDKNST